MKQETVYTDIVVVGYGLAGAITAISARDAGSEVVILEKAAKFGGNSILAGGGILTVEDPEGAFLYLKELCGGKTGDEVLRAQAKKMTETEAYLRELCRTNGATLTLRNRPGIYPFPGRNSFNSLMVDAVPDFEGYPWVSTIGGGTRLMKVIEDNVDKRNIPVMHSTAARELLRENGGAVVGVLAEREGRDVVVKSRKAVVLACGGFEQNRKMVSQYLTATPYYSMAPLTHTGDGIVMSMQLGAALWHMSHVHGSYGFKYPDFKVAFRHHIDGGRDPYEHRPYFIKMRWILIDQKGKRFMDEYPPAPQDTPHRNLAYFDPDLPGFPRIPSYLIFDETARKEARIVKVLGLKEFGYEWSEDNSKEIERGWILRAETLGELSEKIKVPKDSLADTVNRWNSFIKSGRDEDFGRLPGTMSAPIQSPPFYAMESWPIIVNTQGGPEHNAGQQVMHLSEEPIPRLYAAGELGSMFGHLYELAGNLGECVSSGLIAAENACRERPL